MIRPDTPSRPHDYAPLRWLLLAPVLLAPLAFALLSPETAGTTSRDGARAVDSETLATALGAQPILEGVRADEVAFFEARLAADPQDALARRRLAAVHQMRFRAYGDPADLARVDILLDELARTHPHDAGVLSMRTSLALAGHDFPGALEASRARVGLGDPGATDTALGLFDALWATGNYAEAKKILESSRGEDASMARLSREARLVDGMGDVAAAAERMERVVTLTDAYAESPVVRAWARAEHGNFLLHSGDPDGATGRFEEALALVPAYPAALEGLGSIAYGVDGEFGAAEALFEASLEYGRHLDLYGVLAEIARAGGDAERADGLELDFIRLATADPATERLYRRPLALMLAERPGGLAAALAHAETDLADRQDRMAWATRAWVLHAMGQVEAAAADAERALEWGAPEPDVLYRAGVVFLSVGDRRRGRELLTEALDGRAELGPVTSAEIEGLLSR